MMQILYITILDDCLTCGYLCNESRHVTFEYKIGLHIVNLFR